MEDWRRSGGYVLAALAGMALGFVAGALMAPAEGRETRRRLAQRGRQLAEDAAEHLEEGKRRLTKAVKGGSRSPEEV